MKTGNDKITFVLSDESVNSYGFVVLTSGIDTTQFERNPVMLYMHNRDGNVIGRWENIRKEGKRLLGDAVFDDSTELAATVKKQVENGFLRCVSIGIEEIAIEDLNGIQTVTKCRLIEVSIVDIPSNANAVKLYRRSGGYVYKLNDLDNEPFEDLKTALISLLGLENTATEADILQAVETALNEKETTDTVVDNAILHGYVDKVQRNNFLLMAKGNKAAFMAYVDSQRKAQEPEINRLLQDATGKGQILGCETGIYQRIGAEMGIKTLKELLFTLRPAIKPIDLINRTKDRANWTLSDYRKFAPKELENNRELYARLAKEEIGINIEPHTLEWYRKNNPEYLKEHPEIYNELLQKEKENRLKTNKSNK